MAHRAVIGAARLLAVLAVATVVVGCGSSRASDSGPTTVLDDEAITVASFDFPASELLADLRLCAAGASCPGGTRP